MAQQSVRRLTGGRRVGAQPVDAIAGISDAIVEIGDTAVELMLPTAEIVNPHALAMSSVGWSFSTADSYGSLPQIAGRYRNHIAGIMAVGHGEGGGVVPHHVRYARENQ